MGPVQCMSRCGAGGQQKNQVLFLFFAALPVFLAYFFEMPTDGGDLLGDWGKPHSGQKKAKYCREMTGIKKYKKNIKKGKGLVGCGRSITGRGVG